MKNVIVPKDEYNDDLHMINESDENRSSVMKEQISIKDLLTVDKMNANHKPRLKIRPNHGYDPRMFSNEGNENKTPSKRS